MCRVRDVIHLPALREWAEMYLYLFIFFLPHNRYQLLGASALWDFVICVLLIYFYQLLWETWTFYQLKIWDLIIGSIYSRNAFKMETKDLKDGYWVFKTSSINRILFKLLPSNLLWTPLRLLDNVHVHGIIIIRKLLQMLPNLVHVHVCAIVVSLCCMYYIDLSLQYTAIHLWTVRMTQTFFNCFSVFYMYFNGLIFV